MNNITNKTLKSQAYSKIKNIIHLLVGDRVPFEWVDEYQCFQVVSPDILERKEKPSISHFLQMTQKPTISAKNHNNLYNSLQWFRDLCKEQTISDEIVWKAANQICSSRQWLCISKNDGSRISIEANSKGTERYCTQLKGKVLDKTKALVKRDMESFFLTLTCDPKKYKNLADMWENYLYKEVYPITEHLRKNLGMEYVATMESTKNKRPHIHILMFFPKGTYPELEKLPNNKKILYGRFFNYIKSRVNSERFCLKTVKGEQKAFYLSKYIGKGATKSVFKILEEKKDITTEDKKLLYEFVFLTAFRKRKVLMTRKGCKKSSQNESVENGVSVFAEERENWENLTASQRRSLLNSLCTNSLLRNRKTIYSMSYTTYKNVFGQFPERKQDVDDNFCNQFEKNGRQIYDEENLYTLFVDFVLNWQESKLNRRFYWDVENNIYDLFTDSYNMNDDEQFLQCCSDLLTLYLSGMTEKNLTIKDVMENRKNLSEVFIPDVDENFYFKPEMRKDPKTIYYPTDKISFKEVLIYKKEQRKKDKLLIKNDMKILDITNLNKYL